MVVPSSLTKASSTVPNITTFKNSLLLQYGNITWKTSAGGIETIYYGPEGQAIGAIVSSGEYKGTYLPSSTPTTTVTTPSTSTTTETSSTTGPYGGTKEYDYPISWSNVQNRYGTGVTSDRLDNRTNYYIGGTLVAYSIDSGTDRGFYQIYGSEIKSASPLVYQPDGGSSTKQEYHKKFGGTDRVNTSLRWVTKYAKSDKASGADPIYYDYMYSGFGDYLLYYDDNKLVGFQKDGEYYHYRGSSYSGTRHSSSSTGKTSGVDDSWTVFDYSGSTPTVTVGGTTTKITSGETPTINLTKTSTGVALTSVTTSAGTIVHEANTAIVAADQAMQAAAKLEPQQLVKDYFIEGDVKMVKTTYPSGEVEIREATPLDPVSGTVVERTSIDEGYSKTWTEEPIYSPKARSAYDRLVESTTEPEATKNFVAEEAILAVEPESPKTGVAGLVSGFKKGAEMVSEKVEWAMDALYKGTDLYSPFPILKPLEEKRLTYERAETLKAEMKEIGFAPETYAHLDKVMMENKKGKLVSEYIETGIKSAASVILIVPMVTGMGYAATHPKETIAGIKERPDLALVGIAAGAAAGFGLGALVKGGTGVRGGIRGSKTPKPSVKTTAGKTAFKLSGYVDDQRFWQKTSLGDDFLVKVHKETGISVDALQQIRSSGTLQIGKNLRVRADITANVASKSKFPTTSGTLSKGVGRLEAAGIGKVFIDKRGFFTKAWKTKKTINIKPSTAAKLTSYVDDAGKMHTIAEGKMWTDYTTKVLKRTKTQETYFTSVVDDIATRTGKPKIEYSLQVGDDLVGIADDLNIQVARTVTSNKPFTKTHIIEGEYFGVDVAKGAKIGKFADIVATESLVWKPTQAPKYIRLAKGFETTEIPMKYGIGGQRSIGIGKSGAKISKAAEIGITPKGWDAADDIVRIGKYTKKDYINSLKGGADDALKGAIDDVKKPPTKPPSGSLPFDDASRSITDLKFLDKVYRDTSTRSLLTPESQKLIKAFKSQPSESTILQSFKAVTERDYAILKTKYLTEKYASSLKASPTPLVSAALRANVAQILKEFTPKTVESAGINIGTNLATLGAVSGVARKTYQQKPTTSGVLKPKDYELPKPTTPKGGDLITKTGGDTAQILKTKTQTKTKTTTKETVLGYKLIDLDRALVVTKTSTGKIKYKEIPRVAVPISKTGTRPISDKELAKLLPKTKVIPKLDIYTDLRLINKLQEKESTKILQEQGLLKGITQINLTGVRTGLRTKQKQRTKTRTQTAIMTGQMIFQEQDYRTDLMTRQDTMTMTGILQLEKTDTRIIPKTPTTTTTTPPPTETTITPTTTTTTTTPPPPIVPPIMVPPWIPPIVPPIMVPPWIPPIIPPIIPFNLPDAGAGGYGAKARPKKRVVGYKPSVIALHEGIFAKKAPIRTSGFGVRPILGKKTTPLKDMFDIKDVGRLKI